MNRPNYLKVSTKWVEDLKAKKYSGSGPSQDNIDFVRTNVVKEPKISVTAHSQEIGQQLISTNNIFSDMKISINEPTGHIQGEENSRIINEKPQTDEAIIIKNIKYNQMITEFIWPDINNVNLDDMRFQQHDATPHFPKETIQLGQVISRNGVVNWP